MKNFFLLLLKQMSALRLALLSLILIAVVLVVVRLNQPLPVIEPPNDKSWHAPDTILIPHSPEGDLIRYGRKLIAKTSYYLGPKGIVAHVSNSMNCQNCHLDAGSKPYGNSFAAVASIYPVFRNRSGIIESIEFRINDCMQRSMNGEKIDSTSLEMIAMVAYIKWLGEDVPKGTKPEGSGLAELTFMPRPADTLQGRLLYQSKCLVCHGHKGDGVPNLKGGFVYPPLWGPDSYNSGAGLLRLTRFAAFVRFSMPLGATHDAPILTDEESWDLAAFVNSRPRTNRVFPEDWPDLKKKAIDYPVGPYPDSFSVTQHKYGPFGPIQEARKKK
jgi:thiosulfate dehydrogenase